MTRRHACHRLSRGHPIRDRERFAETAGVFVRDPLVVTESLSEPCTQSPELRL